MFCSVRAQLVVFVGRCGAQATLVFAARFLRQKLIGFGPSYLARDVWSSRVSVFPSQSFFQSAFISGMFVSRATVLLLEFWERFCCKGV